MDWERGILHQTPPGLNRVVRGGGTLPCGGATPSQYVNTALGL